MQPIYDPRLGDVESNSSSPKKHSLLLLAGSLLAEISLPKLVAAWFLLIGLPGLVLGVAPILASIWLGEVFGQVMALQVEVWSALVLAALAALALFSSRRLFRMAEHSFWSLNALAVQPFYAMCREGLRQLVEGKLAPGSAKLPLARSAAAMVAGLLISGVALLALVKVWPTTLFIGDFALLDAPRRLARAAFANSAALVGAYVAVAALGWGIADATMDQPRDLDIFDPPPADGDVWRIVHLSDIHVVGERYGFRIESGRAGPRGNERLQQVFERLEVLHAEAPLHAILITGDVTDAGLSSEWAEFFDIVARHPALAGLIAIAPGNHDLNIVDRSNPARLDLPMSPVKRLRKLRVLAAMGDVQGERARVVDPVGGRLGGSLSAALAPHRRAIELFMDEGRPVFSAELSDVWTRAFPLAIAPERDDGLGLHPAELQRRHPFLVHQRFGDDLVGTGPRHQCGHGALSPGALGDRPASPSGGISAPGQGDVGAHRHGADQRRLVRPPDAGSGGPRGRDARPPAHRLGRRMRRASHRLGAVAGHDAA